MRVHLIILVITLFLVQVSARSHAQKLTIHLKQASLPEIFQEIRRQSPVDFFYKEELISNLQKVDLNITDASLAEVLEHCLANTSLGYTIDGDIVVIKRKEITAAIRQIAILGNVVDAATGEPLQGVTVQPETAATLATTDNAGNFRLDIDQDLPITLVFSSVGYQKRAVVIERSPVTISLRPQIEDLSEVVVVGYGTRTRASLTNAVATVEGTQLTKRPVSNIQQSLQGLLPGITVLDRGGKPGQSAATVRVRGITTFNTNSSSTSGYGLDKNNALVIVDGVEQSWSRINPHDIESISVLKDASSTAIYGSRATNGVILITTKSAKEGKIQINYDTYYAAQRSINKPQQMGLQAYMQLQQDAYRNAGIAIPDRFTDESIATWVSATDREQYPLPNTWFETLLNTALHQDHSLSFAGGSESLQARLSLRYNDQDGVIDHYGSRLGEVRLNTNYHATDWLSFNGNVNYRYDHAFEPAIDPINTFFHGSMWAYPKYSDGTYGLSNQGNNPLMLIEQSGLRKVNDDYFSGVFKGDVKLGEGLAFSSQFGARIDFIQTKSFANAYTNTDKNKGVTRNVPINSLTERRNSVKEYTWNNLLTYDRFFDRHHVTALAGYSQIRNYQTNLYAYRERFYNNDITSIGQGADDGTKDNGGYDADFGLRSYFGRLNYEYGGKYLFEANGRYDGSSMFTGDRQYGFFPSFSAGWVLSKERFWQPLERVVGDLKLRASWGKTGNQSVDLYSYYAALVAAGYNFGGEPVQGYRLARYANRDLGWESTTQYDIGIDASLLGRKLYLTADYYHKTTDDILLNLDIPAILGLDPSPQNAGSVRNKGWEFGVTYQEQPVNDNGFGYVLRGNFSMNDNQVTDLKNTGPYITGSDIDPRYIISNGLPINTLWGYQTDGLFQSLEEIAAYGATYVPNMQPGDVKYVDRNGDGVINADDMTAIGNSFPKYTFGLNTTFNYRNFDLDLLFQGAADVDTRLAGALAEMGNQEGFTHEVFTRDYWTPENPGARFPRVVKFDLRNVATSDRLVIDGSYLRLKNVLLGYNVPSTYVNRIKLQGLRIYVAATNLWTLSKLNEWNLDPEVESGRAVYYPQTALYTIGLNVKF